MMDAVSTTVAYVTGASRGIGRLLATSLAAEGARVAGFARASVDLESLRGQPGELLPIPMDVGNPASVTSGFARAHEELGDPTLMITCAGAMGALGPIASVDPEHWWRAVTVDLRGTMLCVRAALSTMIPQSSGRIVTVYGNLGDDGREHVSAFAAAKAGVARFTETLASELAGSGVIAVSMHPGFVHTPMTEHLASSAEGRQWLPSFGKRAPDHWGDGASAYQLVRQIIAGAADELSGRVVAADDELARLVAASADDADVRRLRLRFP